VIGLTLANTIKPGTRIDPSTKAALEQRYASDATKQVEAVKKGGTVPTPLMQVVETLVPSNPFAAMAGVPSNPSTATTGWRPEYAAPDVLCSDHRHCHDAHQARGDGSVPRGLQGLYEITAKIIEIIMKFAPYAVACLLFNNTAAFGLDLLQALGWFIATVMIGLSLHMFGVYSLSIALLSRMSPLEFFRRIKTVILTAFSTSSSNATLPTALRISEENLGVPKEINSFRTNGRSYG
jgi:DAACS family dicarboxylate/amino acid:cation (Na+ or H+) symporter